MLLSAVLALFACSPPQLWSQQLFVRGVCYSPFRDGQSPATGVYPTRNQITEDMRILRRYTSAVRFYGLGGTQSLIPDLARANGLQCYAGAWIDTGAAANATEIAALKKIARARRATAVVVGNEVLLRGSLPPGSLVSQITDVKSVSKVPVGYADTVAEWLSHPEVAEAVDFLLVHIYPYWDGSSDTGADYVRQQWEMVANAYPDKPVIIGETGWPTAGLVHGAAVPAPENQRAFLGNFTPMALEEGIPYFLFEAFDEAWKADTSGVEVEAHWGLFQSDRQLKPLLGDLFSNPQPMVDITQPAKRGAGALSHGTIAGRVYGIQKTERKNYAVVVYAGTDKWYVQPSTVYPQTQIRANFTWATSTHLGYEYLALLVRSSYQPPAIMYNVPSPGGDILAVCRSQAQAK